MADTEKSPSVFDETSAEMDETTRALLQHAGDSSGDHLVRDFNERVTDLMELAPSDATVSLVLRQERGAIMGHLEIHSIQGKFAAARTDAEVAPVIHAIFAGVEKQIDEWQRNRHISVPDPL